MDYYNAIKNKLIDNEVYKKVKDYSKNRNDLQTYFDVGKLLIEAQGGLARAKYGDRLIKEYSKKLTDELGKGYSERHLKYMRKFYLYQKGHPLNAQLTWTHYRLLLSMKDDCKINYYIGITIEQNLSYRELRERIKSNEYERLDESTKNKLINRESLNLSDSIKHPIIIKNKYNTELITEKMLKQLILDDISRFMKELGNGFCFIESEYKIKLGDRYNYIDILLFNYEYNCFVVVELKVTELKAEHIGQIQKYMNYIDMNVKNVIQDKTIGIIIAKKDNRYVMQYCSDEKIFRTTYELI